MNIKCPHCGTEYEVDKKDMYRYTKCEVCGKGFVMGATAAIQTTTGSKSNRNVDTKQPLKCPSCGTWDEYHIPENGKVVCSLCGKAFAGKGASVFRNEAASDQETMEARCPHCGVVYEVHRDWFGRMVSCETCGKNFTIGISQSRKDQIENERQRKEDHWAKKFFSLHGRAARKEYWITSLLSALLVIVIGIIVCIEISPNSSDFEESIGALALVDLILITPVTVRRLHDLNVSGWFVLVVYLIAFIPIRATSFATLFLGIQKGTCGDNAFGSDPLAQA